MGDLRAIRRWLGRGLAIGVAVALLLVLGLLRASVEALEGRARPPRPRARPPAHFAVQGIDISHHQGAVDWSAVARSGEVDFAFLKATEGTHHVDRRFAKNWKEARRHGLPVGAYHYFRLCRTGADQAAHFIRHVPREAGTLPPVVDIEPDRWCNRGSRLGRVGPELRAWLVAVEAHYGVKPLVYTSASFYRSHLHGAGLGASLWAAAYSREPHTPGTDWLFWQYSDRGLVPGVRGPVDRNVFRGGPPELEGLRRAPAVR